MWPDQSRPNATIGNDAAPGTGPTLASSGNQTWYPPVQPGNLNTPPVMVGSIPVMARASWTSAEPKWSRSKPMNGVQRITVHHDALNAAGLRGQSAAAARLESIRRSHLARGSEWVDIGYHYIIDPDGPDGRFVCGS